ncbi:MAG TPA: YdeI/OmpD-associated family protein [Candidatus Babeliales bacterium]|nr:YdeI/OmpD-associated family protein [Candidatus Babeliales bacterium]
MTHAFRARLEGSRNSAGTWVLVPPAIMKRFGGRIRVPVCVTINGVTWRTTIADMGAGPMIGVTAATRKAAGIERGDPIELTIEEDTEKRTVDVPADFAKAMNRAQHNAFDSMSYTHRKEYVQWIEAAKKRETRARRIRQALAKLDERART